MSEKVKRKSAKDEVLTTLENRRILPVDFKTYDRLLRLTSGRIYDPLIQRLADGTYTVKYTKKSGTDEIRFVFPSLDEKQFGWIVRKVKRKTKQGEKIDQEIVNFDDLARRVLFIELLFAWGTGSEEFVYRPYDMLYWLDLSDHKKGFLRDRVTAITHALALAVVIIKKQNGEETRIEHFMSLVDRGKGPDRKLEVSLYRNALMPLWPALMKQLKKNGKLPQTVGYPVTALAYIPKRLQYVSNFIDWAREYKGMGQTFWPMKIETVLIAAMRMTPEQTRYRKKTLLEDMFFNALIEGKKEGVITGWGKFPETEKLSKSEFLKFKIKLFFPDKRRELFEYPHLVEEKTAEEDLSEDKQIDEIAAWLHQKEFETKRNYRKTVKMLREAKKRLGKKELRVIFLYVTERSDNCHPKAFWEEIGKELRRCG